MTSAQPDPCTGRLTKSSAGEGQRRSAVQPVKSTVMPVRYYWVDYKDGIHRVPASRFIHVFAGEEPAPEFSGRQIRFVEAAIETEGRKPVSILRLIYPLLSFNERGGIDEEAKERERRSSVESRAEGNLLRSGGRFERKQFESEFRWSPSQELESLIVRQIFAKLR